MPNQNSTPQALPEEGNTTTYLYLDEYPVRVQVKADGSAWFVAADICAVLQLKNVTMALRRLDPDDRQVIAGSEKMKGKRGGPQMLNVINESGLYYLILTSRKPNAIVFRRWVTWELLPSARQQGFYSYNADLFEDREKLCRIANLVVEYAQKFEDQEITAKAQQLASALLDEQKRAGV